MVDPTTETGIPVHGLEGQIQEATGKAAPKSTPTLSTIKEVG